MSKVIKAMVINGRYKGETVRITNISVDGSGRQNAACFLASGERANIPVNDLSVIEGPAPLPEPKRANCSMTKNMQKPKIRNISFTKNENDEEE